MNIISKDSIERVLRKVAFLEGDYQNAREYEFVPVEGRSSYTLEKLEEEKVNEKRKAWDQQPKRAHLVHELSRRIYSAQYNLVENYVRTPENLTVQKLANDFIPGYEKKKIEKALANTKILTYESYHINPKNAIEIEGGISFDKERGYGIDFITPGILEVYAESERKFMKNESSILFDTLPFNQDSIVINSEYITHDNLKQAIEEWYIDRYRYTPGHWTHDGSKPEIILKVEWDEKEVDETTQTLSKAIK